MDLGVLAIGKNCYADQYQLQLDSYKQEFQEALHTYQDFFSKLRQEPNNNDLREQLDCAEKKILKISVQQKLFLDGIRERSRVTPAIEVEMRPPQEAMEIKAEEPKENRDSNPNGVISSHQYSPPISEDEQSELCRSLSSTSGVSGCADSMSCSSSVTNTPMSSRPNSPANGGHKPEAMPYPADSMEQEAFLKSLGLITHASLKTKSETKRVERRRRTTANPKYNRNGFIDTSHIAKRNKKIEEVNNDLAPSPKKVTVTPLAVQSQGPRLTCIICEQLGCNLTCETCSAQVHSDCIKVSGSKAPTPTRLPKCPDCVAAANEARRCPGVKTENAFQFQQPLIPTTPIIPANLKRKSLSVSVKDKMNSNNDVKTSQKVSKSKKLKEEGLPGVPDNEKPVKGTANSKSSVVRNQDNIVKLGSVEAHKGEICGKPSFSSPFKTLTTLTGKSLNGSKIVKLASINSSTHAFSNGSSQNPLHTMKKKSKINGVKAKTLSVTGRGPNVSSVGGAKVINAKASPIISLNMSGSASISKGKSNFKSGTRLPKDNGDPESLKKTILAFTAAAKSVMCGNGLARISAGNLLSGGNSSSPSLIRSDSDKSEDSTPVKHVNTTPAEEETIHNQSSSVSCHENITITRTTLNCSPAPLEIN